MAIKVEAEPNDMGPVLERCCFCRDHTRYWIVNADVACCESCASRATKDDIPSKQVWCRRERIADPDLKNF